MITSLLNLPILKRDARRDFTPVEAGIYVTDRHTNQRQPSAPNLRNILADYGAFPPYSLVIGLCQDGLPFMLDLGNPRSGSILVVGEKGCGKTQLLNVIGQSACLLNSPKDINLYVVTNKPYEFTNLSNNPHNQGLLSPFDREVGELVVELASISEQRQTGRELGSKIILIIDDLACIARMLSDYSVHLNLKTLVSRGPASGIWPIISINPNDIPEEKSLLLRAFGTYIFERSSRQSDVAHAQNQASEPMGISSPTFDVIIGGMLNPIINLAV
jgi:hypothetical protein